MNKPERTESADEERDKQLAGGKSTVICVETLVETAGQDDFAIGCEQQVGGKSLEGPGGDCGA